MDASSLSPLTEMFAPLDLVPKGQPLCIAVECMGVQHINGEWDHVEYDGSEEGKGQDDWVADHCDEFQWVA